VRQRERPVVTVFGDVFAVGYSLEQRMSKDSLIAFCKRNHIRRLSVFGSAIRGELRPESDLDILVEFEPNHTPGLFPSGQNRDEFV
jgi:predicted nucleotidyltransferase